MSARRGSFLLESGGGFPMTPMIDIVFNLLIFFMLISRYMPPALSLTLPEAASAAPSDKASISISINALGALNLDGALLDWSALGEALAGEDPRTQVRIAADSTADYSYVVKALDACARAGLTQIALEAQPPPEP
jgi:biopolymer transport protein ExbD